MNFREVTLVLFIAVAVPGGALAASDDEAAALTTQILDMDANATIKGSGAVTGKLAADFETFAGSKENSTALVTGLRNGSEITLTQQGEPSATFTPATKQMGYGNVSTSLALAKYQLGQQGITNPTPEQLQTALNGGTITIGGKTVAYQGVLQMRADGLGWGEIAQQLGTKLGPVVSGIEAQNAHIATRPAAQAPTTATTQGVATAGSARSSAPTGGNKGASSGKRVVTAGGVPAKGGSTGKGPSSGKGIVTAGDGTAGTSNGRSADHPTMAGGGASAARGQGVVTAAGRGGSPVAHGITGAGSGVVSASGATASGAPSAGGPGNGKAFGRVK